jgi:UDP:flavonoid glycosyltransferase YjiC (YdhE family)
MGLILFLPYFHELGTTIGLVDLALTLRDLGNECIFAGEGKFINIPESHGFKVESLTEINFDLYRKHIDKGNLTFHNIRSIKEHVAAELTLYKKIRPDIIISQGRTTPAISARVANIPLICVTISFLTRYYSLPITIPETFNIYPLVKIPILGEILNSNIKRILHYKSSSAVKPYNIVAKDYGLKPFKDMYEMYEGSFMTLIAEDKDMFPINNPENGILYYFTGPLLHHQHFATPDWLINYKKMDGYYIYLSMGSSSDKLYPEVLKRVINIFGERKGFNIITNSCYLLESKIHKIPSNFLITETAPANIIFKLADLTITHGGKNTIYHSLLDGVPILGIPQQAEQEINLKRIKELNLGDMILAKQFLKSSDGVFYNKIYNVLHNKVIQNNVSEYSKKLHNSMLSLDSIINIINNQINGGDN